MIVYRCTCVPQARGGRSEKPAFPGGNQHNNYIAKATSNTDKPLKTQRRASIKTHELLFCRTNRSPTKSAPTQLAT